MLDISDRIQMIQSLVIQYEK